MTWNSCPGDPSLTQTACVHFKKIFVLQPCYQPSQPLPDYWDFQANLFYFFCLHLSKGDSNQGHSQAPRPISSSLDPGDVLKSPCQLCLFLPPPPPRRFTT